MDTDQPIDLAIEELIVALGDDLPPDCERGKLRLACQALSDEFAMIPSGNRMAA